MRKVIGLIFCLSVFLLGCNEKTEPLVLNTNSIKKAIELEKSLGSVLLSENSNGVLSSGFLPVDTTLKMKNKVKYLRENKEGLSLQTKCYLDDSGNELIIYDWDKELPSMSESEKQKIRKDFGTYNSLYSAKYNELAIRLIEELGEPKYKDDQLNQNKSSIIKTWSSKYLWEKDNQIIELKIILVPHSFYKVLLKQLVLVE